MQWPGYPWSKSLARFPGWRRVIQVELRSLPWFHRHRWSGGQRCDDADPLVHPGTPEICNGIDDYCNGVVDEGLGTTTCGIGACRRTVDTCVGGVPQTCVPGEPSPEVCNGIDDNCNGLVDEGLNRIVGRARFTCNPRLGRLERK